MLYLCTLHSNDIHVLLLIQHYVIVCFFHAFNLSVAVLLSCFNIVSSYSVTYELSATINYQHAYPGCGKCRVISFVLGKIVTAKGKFFRLTSDLENFCLD